MAEIVRQNKQSSDDIEALMCSHEHLACLVLRSLTRDHVAV